MCFGSDSPQQPVQPAPYPWAELNVKDSRAPDKTPIGNEADTEKPTSSAGPVSNEAGANYKSLPTNNLGM